MISMRLKQFPRLAMVLALPALLMACPSSNAEDTQADAKPGEIKKAEGQFKATGGANPLADAPVTAMMGKLAPDFTLTDTDGKKHQLSKYVAQGKVVVLEWFNPDCPFVKKHHLNNKTMKGAFEAFAEKDIVWLAINSGGKGKQGHGLERNQKARQEYDIAYPVLLDESGKVGQVYGAKTTPQLYVISREGNLVYNGPLDDVPNPGTIGDMDVFNSLMGNCCEGKDVEPTQIKSYGCSVKYAS